MNTIKQYANFRQKKSGFTLVEIAMVLSVAALIIAGVLYFYLSANENRKVQQTLSELALIMAAVQAQYGNQTNYSELTTADVIKGGNFPYSYINSTGGLLNPFGGIVGINRSGYNQGMYAVAFTNVPVDACVKLVLADLGPQMFLINVDFGDGAFGRAMSIGDAYYRCQINQTNVRHVVAWTFR